MHEPTIDHIQTSILLTSPCEGLIAEVSSSVIIHGIDSPGLSIGRPLCPQDDCSSTNMTQWLPNSLTRDTFQVARQSAITWPVRPHTSYVSQFLNGEHGVASLGFFSSVNIVLRWYGLPRASILAWCLETRDLLGARAFLTINTTEAAT